MLFVPFQETNLEVALENREITRPVQKIFPLGKTLPKDGVDCNKNNAEKTVILNKSVTFYDPRA